MTAPIVMVKVCVALVSTPPNAVPPSSWIWSVTVAIPLAFAAGVKVNVPAADTAGCAENRALLLLEIRLKSTVCDASLAGPAEIAVAQPATVAAPLSSFTVWFAPLVKLGTSFTELTTMTNVWGWLVSSPPLAVPPLSTIETVTVAVPNSFPAGWKVRVPSLATSSDAKRVGTLALTR